MVFDLAVVEEIKNIAANLTRWTGSVLQITERKMKKGCGKGRRISFLFSCSGHALRGPVLHGTADFRDSLSDLSEPSSGTFRLNSLIEGKSHAERAPSTGKIANLRRSSIRSTQRLREP